MGMTMGMGMGMGMGSSVYCAVFCNKYWIVYGEETTKRMMITGWPWWYGRTATMK